MMIIKHACGHEIEAHGRFAPFVRRELCDECKELAKKLQEEQSRKFSEAD